MWDNQALDLISNVLIVAAVLTSGYFISQWAVNAHFSIQASKCQQRWWQRWW